MATKTAKYTKTPWTVNKIGSNIYIETHDDFICDMQADKLDSPDEFSQIEANADFIVLACNSHDALLKQNKIFSHALSYLEWGSPEHAEELLLDLIRQFSEAEVTTESGG